MISAIDFAKGYLIPGSTGFLLFGLALGTILLYGGRSARWGRRWLTGLLAIYVMLSLPAVARVLHRGVVVPPAVATAADAPGVAAIVVLGNGAVTFGPPGREIDLPGRNTAHNVLEAVRLHRLLPGTRIIPSGGIPVGGINRRPESDVMAEYLRRLGVPEQDILPESRSVNTGQQAAHVAALLGKGARCLLVTAPTHMARAMGAFRHAGLEVIPAPAAGPSGDDGVEWIDLLPDRSALRASERAIYERLGLMYYRVTGRLAPADADAP